MCKNEFANKTPFHAFLEMRTVIEKFCAISASPRTTKQAHPELDPPAEYPCFLGLWMGPQLLVWDPPLRHKDSQWAVPTIVPPFFKCCKVACEQIKLPVF